MIIHILWVIIDVINFTVDQEKYFVFEFVGCTCVYAWIEEAQFLDVEVGYLKLIANWPLISFSGEENYSVQFRNKGHKLATNTRIQKDRSDLVLELERIIDPKLFIRNSGEMNGVLLNKDPFILLDGKAIE